MTKYFHTLISFFFYYYFFTHTHCVQITSLEEQLKSSQSHAEQYKSISEANEKSLEELNATSEIFKTTMNQELERLKVMYCMQGLV